MQAVSQAHLMKETLSGEEGRVRSPRSHRVVITRVHVLEAALLPSAEGKPENREGGRGRKQILNY